MIAAVKRCSNSRRQSVRFRFATRLMASTISSSVSHSNPVTPSRSTSGTEPRGRAITGVPQARASIMTNPKGSGQSIGNSNAMALPSRICFCASSTSPMNSMSG